MTAALSAVGLTRAFAGASSPALLGLDLDVPAGDCVALLGPSGSGKTTTLRLVAGLDAPDSGDVRIGGLSVVGLPPERRGMSMVSQRPLLFPHLSVRDNIAFAPRMAGLSKREAHVEAERYLGLVQLAGYGRRRPGTLSGGQQQRVALARALAASPAVLLLDEPFSALDPALRDDMHQLLIDIRTALRPTILMVTHDREEAVRLADSIGVLVDGSLLQCAAAHDLYRRPASLQVSRFLGSLNEISGHLVDGRHVSALGSLKLPKTELPNTGAAVLVVRQEAVRLVDATSSGAIVGVVERVTPRGARMLVKVSTQGGALYAESAPGEVISAGDRVGLEIPVDQRWVVADQADTSAETFAR